MKFVFFFLGTSTLFTAAAIPMLSFGNPPSNSQGSRVPKVDFGYRSMTAGERTAAKDLIIDHYNGLEPWSDRKQSNLAYVEGGWRDGNGLDDSHKQYLDFNYHRGEHQYTAKIGQTVTVSRDKPPPESHFASTVSKENKPEISTAMDKEFKTLPPEQARHVKSLKAHGDWVDGPGLREETQMSFHRGIIPTKYNKLGDPVTIYRPVSFLIDRKVPKNEVPVIKKRVRQEHEKLDDNHPLKQANYGVVTEGWKVTGPGMSQHVGTTLYKVKNKLSDDAEEDFEKIGDFRVSLGKGRRPEADVPSGSSKRRRN